MSTTLYANQVESFLEESVFTDVVGNIIDVTGHTGFIKVSKYFGSKFSITINGVPMFDGQNHYMSFSAPASKIQEIEQGAHVYTKVLIDPDGKVVTSSTGSFIVTQTV